MKNINELLSAEEVAFVQRVYLNPGSKIKDCFHHVDDGSEYGVSVSLWANPEKLGLIKCVGSYKWEPVNLTLQLFATKL